MSYILELRRWVGKRPLIYVGSSIIPVNTKGEVLLVFRADAKAWDFPSGGMELGESGEETASRELLEETGLTAESLELLGFYAGKQTFFEYPNGDQIYMANAAYIARGLSGDLVPNEEVEKLGFFALDSLPEPFFHNAREILADFLKRSAPSS